MNSRKISAAFSLVLLPGALAAQVDVRPRMAPRVGSGFEFFTDDNESDRPVIGISTDGGSARDTLGVLVTEVTPNGPAERAGLEEGNRIASVNGVNLKLAPSDTGDWEMSGLMTRRLTRELGKVKPGDEVELRVYASGQSRTVRVKTVPYDSLYQRRMRYSDNGDNRAVLGVGLGSNNSRRDTLGVLIMSVDDSGPAAKAGIEEGNRVSAINGVDLRVRAEDAGDDLVGNAKLERLRRELAKVKPGDEVELKLFADGRPRTVRVKTVAASSLRGGHSMYMEPGAFMMPHMDMDMHVPMPAMPPMPPMPRTRIHISTMTSM
jgi:serine protease Do